jgi:hypothetical protein
MALNKTIFGLRFGADETLYPAPTDIKVFLESPNKKGERGRHDDDLAAYRDLLARVTTFERQQQRNVSLYNFRERMFNGVLSLSHFINPVLKREVELYKYYVHGFTVLDFKKPAAFIKAADEEMSTLNPKRKQDAGKLHRLEGMVEERRRTLETQEKRRAALARELGSIARYVRSNLLKIGKLCEASIVILMELQMSGKMAGRLIEEIKEDFREHLEDVMHQGPVTGQYLDTVKQDLSMLISEMSVLVREDLFALAGLYEAIYDQTKRIVHELDIRLAGMEIRKKRSFEEDSELFTQVEQVLVSLISGYHFELKARNMRAETAHESILMEKRHEMIEDIFELLSSERRVRTDRRSDDNRRRFNEPEDRSRERRQRIVRSGKDRREPVASGVYL